MQRLLILGWGDSVLMIDLLSELDHGPSALPKGSEVTMFNTRTAQEVLGKLVAVAVLSYTCFHHNALITTPDVNRTCA